MNSPSAEGREPVQYPLHRFAALGELTPDDVSALTRLGEPAVRHARGDVIRTQGDETDGIYLLIDGWVSSSLTLRNGKRLVQKLHLPGDMMGTPSLALPVAADTLTTLTAATTSFVPAKTMRALFASNPRLTAMLLMASQLERLALMDALASAGQATGLERMAHLLLDLHHRLGALGEVRENGFPLPVTQECLGQIVGLTTVHVNRTLREMVRQGLIEMKDRRVRLLDMAALRTLSPIPVRRPAFEPSWIPRGTAVQPDEADRMGAS